MLTTAQTFSSTMLQLCYFLPTSTVPSKNVWLTRFARFAPQSPSSYRLVVSEVVPATVQVWSTYSPVKNNPADALAKVEAGGPSHSATTGELDVYQVNCRSLLAPARSMCCCDGQA